MLADRRPEGHAGGLDCLTCVALGRGADDECLLVDTDRDLLQFVKIVEAIEAVRDGGEK